MEETTGLVRAVREKTEAEAGAAVASAVVTAALHGQGQPASAAATADPLKAIDVVDKVTGVYDRAMQRVQEDNKQLRDASGQSYQGGREDERVLADIQIDALQRSHEMHLASLRTIQEITDKKDERFESTVSDLRGEIGKLREQTYQQQIDQLKAELEKAKSGGGNGQPAAGGTASVPIIGMKQVQLPNGQVVYVMEQPANGKSDLATLKESLGHLKDLKADMDGIFGGGQPRAAHDLNDPDVRWRHTQIDWEAEARRREEDRKDRLANAQVEREHATTEVIKGLPSFAQRHLPRVGAALFGGAPERGSHNGMPDRPPSRPRRDAPPEAGATSRQPPQDPPPPAPAAAAGGDELGDDGGIRDL